MVKFGAIRLAQDRERLAVARSASLRRPPGLVEIVSAPAGSAGGSATVGGLPVLALAE